MLGGWSLLAGWNGGKEYAELEWPFDIAITVVWLSYAVVFFGTIARRKIAPIYISNWFYGALIIVDRHAARREQSRAARRRSASRTRCSRARKTRSSNGGTAITRSGSY